MKPTVDDSRTPSAVEYDRVKTSYQVAKAQVDQATQDLRKGQAGARPEDIRAMESTLRGLQSQVEAAEAALKDTELRAPFRGLVGNRYAENFQTVRANEPIVTLQGLDAIDLTIALPERDLARARSVPDPPDPGALRLPPRTDLRPDPEGGGSDVTLFALPPSVLMAESGESQSVWKADAASLTVHRRPITVRGDKGDSVLVEELQAGDRIVTAGVPLLSKGDEIAILKETD